MINILGPDGQPYLDAKPSIASLASLSSHAMLGAKTDDCQITNPIAGMQHPAVFRCLEFLSHACAKTPLQIKRNTVGGGCETDLKHPASYLVDGDANGLHSSYAYRYITTKLAAYWGNSVSYIVRDENAKPLALVPFQPGCFGIEVADGKLSYSLYVRGEWHVGIPHTDIHHLWFWSVDGLIGLPWWQWHSKTLGLGIAAQDWASKYYSGGAQPVSILTYPIGLNKDPESEDHKQYIQSYKDALSRLGRDYRTIFIHPDQTYTRVSDNAEDSQLTESREMSAREVCMLFGFPPFVIGLDQSGPYKSVEEKSQLVIDALDPYFCRIQDESRRKLLTERQKRERSRHVIYDREAIKQIDAKAFVEIVKTKVQASLATVAEGREMCRLPTTGQPGEDKLWIASGFQTIENASSRVEKGDWLPSDETNPQLSTDSNPIGACPLSSTDQLQESLHLQAKSDGSENDDFQTADDNSDSQQRTLRQHVAPSVSLGPPEPTEPSSSEAAAANLPPSAIEDADRRATAVIQQAFERRVAAGPAAILDLLATPDKILDRVARIYEPLGLLEQRQQFTTTLLIQLIQGSHVPRRSAS